MKSIQELNYYEILEISPTATEKEIQKAYEHAQETFRADSLAVYSLFSGEEVKEVQKAVEEAYRVLMDKSLRDSYDRSHIQAGEKEPPERPFETPAVPEDKVASLSFTDVSINTREEPDRRKMLKQAREKMGIDLRTISGETKINLKTLEWIEEEAFEKLPPLVYLKGFLKSYARFLGMDSQKLIEDYIRLMEESKKR